METLGWYEESPRPSLQLIETCGLQKDALMFHAGIGVSTLADTLVNRGYTRIIFNDISQIALDTLQDRLPNRDDLHLKYICEDISKPVTLLKIPKVDLWHDRAVLHFLTETTDQNTYFNLLKDKVQPGGYAILATFNLSGATKCSGLPVYPYDQEMLRERLGGSLVLMEAFEHDYMMPSGDIRPYIYILFQRI